VGRTARREHVRAGYIRATYARLIDHTLLKPDASADQIAQLCREAREYHFATVCVNSAWAPLCADLLKGSDVAVCTVVGFPLGATLPEVKAYEAQLAIHNGAGEIDMVMNIGALKSRDLKMLYRDISTVVATSHAHNVLCKVILETSTLTDEEKVIASQVPAWRGEFRQDQYGIRRGRRDGGRRGAHAQGRWAGHRREGVRRRADL
jgi:deoxyribose-phosphate aldolase